MAIRGTLVTLMPIRKMDRALRFYTRALGAKLVYRGTGPMRNRWASLRWAGADLWLVVPAKREKRTLAYSALLVRNLRSTVRSLTEHGVRFERPTPRGPESRIDGPIIWEPFGGTAFFKDSEGNLLMLWQSLPPT